MRPPIRLQLMSGYLSKPEYMILNFIKQLPADRQGWRVATMLQLAAELACSHATVVRALRELRTKGYILVHHSHQGRRNAYKPVKPGQ